MTFKRMSLMAALTATLIAGAAYAETFQEHFMSSWDANSDGEVTLEEVVERRESVFAAFDANDDGFIDAEERKAMNEMRDTEHASMAEEGIERPNGMGQGKGMGQGHGQAQGMGHGQGKGQGMGPGKGMGQGHGNAMAQGHGQGQGMGQGKGQGMGRGMGGNFQANAEGGMHDGRMIDTDGDGKFSRDEFVGMSATWLARLDNNGDGKIGSADF